MQGFSGSYTMMVSPFDHDGAVDLAALERFVDWQCARGTNGLIPLGSTGEFLSLSVDERRLVARTVIEKTRGRVPVIVGTTGESTDHVIALSREVEHLGADGVMVLPPFYSSPSRHELIHHFRRVADAIDIPLMLYNNPATANVDLQPALIAELSKASNIRYIKESSGDVTRIQRILHDSDGRMQVFAGLHPWESARCGAIGYASVVANIAPDLSAKLFEQASWPNEYEASLQRYHRLAPLIDCLAGDAYVAATKAALDKIGQSMGAPRAPRLPLAGHKNASLDQAIASLHLI